jgi:phage baseplate assembly protein V
MNLVYGEIEQQDLSKPLHQYRVRLSTGELSPWMPALVTVAGATRENHALSKGTQVACFAGLYEGIVLGALNSSQKPATTNSDKIKRTIYPDGAVIEYNAISHQLNAILPAGATTHLTSRGGVTIDGDTTINGDLTVNGDIAVNGNGTVSGNFKISGICGVGSLVNATGGAVVSRGGMQMSGGDVVVDGISATGHTHPESGGGTTGGPT